MIGNYSIVDNTEVLGQLSHFDLEERTVLRRLTSYQIPCTRQSLNVVPNPRMYFSGHWILSLTHRKSIMYTIRGASFQAKPLGPFSAQTMGNFLANVLYQFTFFLENVGDVPLLWIMTGTVIIKVPL